MDLNLNVDKIVEEFKSEISGGNRKDVIDKIIDKMILNIDKLSKTKSFFELPLKCIFYVISRIDFSGSSINTLETMSNFIKNIISSNFSEKETILLFNYLQTSNHNYSAQDYISLLQLFTNCDFLSNFCCKFNELDHYPVNDGDYDLKQKDIEITDLKKRIQELNDELDKFPPIQTKPTNFEGDIWKAAKEGKLDSLQYLIEKEGVSKDSRIQGPNHIDFIKDDTPIHMAAKNGQLKIVQYLIEKQNVDINIKGNYDRTPLHYACYSRSLPVVEYLILHGADPNVADVFRHTPLHAACSQNLVDMVKFLLEHGADKELDVYGRKAKDLTQNEEIKKLLQ